MENFIRLLRRVSSPFRRINKAEEQQPHKKLYIVVGDGYPLGADYVKKTAMDWGRAAAVYGDDVLIAYNNYRKAKQNGNITDRGAIPATTAKKQPIGFQQKI